MMNEDETERFVCRHAPETEKFLPCGHTEEQAQWLKCTKEKCRPEDEWLSEQYRLWVRAGRPGSQQSQPQERIPKGWRQA